MKEIFNELFSNIAIASNGAAEAEGPGIESLFIQLVIIFVIFYFILIRPQQKKQKAQQQMNKELKKGDSVVTISGVYGIINKAVEKEPHVELEISKGIIIKVLRSSIGERLENKVKLPSSGIDEEKPKKKITKKKAAAAKKDTESKAETKSANKKSSAKKDEVKAEEVEEKK